MLERLFDDFEGNINWEDDDKDDKDYANGMVAQPDFSRHQFSNGRSLAEEEEEYRREMSLPPLFTLSLLLANRGGCCVMCVCVCVFRCVRYREVTPQPDPANSPEIYVT